MKKRSCSFRIRDHTCTLISDQICILIQNDQPEKSDLDWTIVYKLCCNKITAVAVHICGPRPHHCVLKWSCMRTFPGNQDATLK